MNLPPAVSVVYSSDNENQEFLGALEQHLATAEEQLESIIKMASKLPVEEQDDYWALAKDLQKEIRLTRKQIEVERSKKIPRLE